VATASSAFGSIHAKGTEAVLGPRPGRLGRGVFVVPVGGLEGVAAAVLAATAGIGQPPEHRRFHGHVTLARLRAAAACGLTDVVVSARWPVTSIALVQSHLHPAGARYETIGEVALAPAVPSDP
jgi:2'-5' RNA ligase